MAQPIYSLFQSKFKEAWYQLSKDEQDDLLRKGQEALEKVGGKSIILCVSGWSSEQWLTFGVEMFPDIEAVQEHSRLLFELNWFRYFDSVTQLGVELGPQ